MRNWWLEADIDGRANNVTGGPRSRDGHMRVSLRQRVDGESFETVSVRCIPNGEELLTVITIKDPATGEVMQKEIVTTR